MKIRCCLVMFILASLLIVTGTANAWLPKSDVKIKKIEKLAVGAVTRLAERDHYFDSSFINSYVKRLMNSIDQNNGQVAIIANDAQMWCKFTFTLDSDENIKGIEIKHYQYDFGGIFRKYNIAPSKWPDLIRQFNTTGYAITTTTSGRIKFYRNFEEDAFSVNVTPQNEVSTPSQPVSGNDKTKTATEQNQTNNITSSGKNATDSTNLNLVRIFHQLVTFYLPKEWGTPPKGDRNQRGGHFMLEFIPDRQDWSNWQDLFAIQGLSDYIKTNGMPIERLTKSAEQTAKDTQTYYKEVYRGDISGYQGAIIIGTTNSNTAKILNRPYTKGEVVLTLYLAGENDLYIATRSWKADISPMDNKLPVSEAEINMWIDLFRQVKLTPMEK